MTCIVGCVDSLGRILMGADSGASSDNEMSMILTAPKVFKKGLLLIGGTGQVRMNQLIEYKLTVPRHSPKKDALHYLATDFVDALRVLFSENGFGPDGIGGDFDGEIMIGYQSRLFRIQSNYQVIESVKSYAAIGNGEAFALGALDVLDRDPALTCRDRVTGALEASTTHCAIIQPPYVCLSLEKS